MTTDIFNAGTASPDEERTEKARRAVQAFRAMQAGLTGYVQALTGNRSMQVVLAEGPPRTDGRKIYFKPPIELGDLKPHDRAKCDRRDRTTGLQLCDACRIREGVLIALYHEVAHNVYGTFEQPTDRAKLEAVERAIAEVPGRYAEKVRKSWDAAPEYKKATYLNLSSLISPFLPVLVNALEDARVDEAMFRARKGTKVMFDAYCKSILANGTEQDDGTIVRWSDKPLNSQILIGVFVVACKYDYADWFHPKVEEALADARLRELIDRIETLRSVEGTYNLAFPILARLRELGFCRNPEEEEDEPEDEPQDGDGNGEDQGDDQPEDSDADPADADGEESDEGSEEPESGDGDSDDESPADDGEPQGDEASDSGVPDSSDGADEGEDASSGESQDDGPSGDDSDSMGSGGAGDDDPEPAQDDDGDGVPDQGGEQDQGSGDSDDDASESDGGSESDADQGSDGADDGMGEGSSGDTAPELPDGDGGDLEDDSRGEGRSGSESDDSSGEGEADDRESSEAEADDTGDASEPVEGEAVDEADTDTDGDTESEGDRGGSDPQEAGNDADDLSDGAGDRDGESDDSEGDEVPADEGRPGDDEGEAESADSVDPIDTGEYDDKGAVEDLNPEYGNADDALEDFKVFTAHEDPPEQIDSSGDKADEEAIDRAIIQSMYFEKPSVNVSGVREHRYGQVTMTKGKKVPGAWDYAQQYGDAERYKATLEHVGVNVDTSVPEQVLGPALNEMRRAFADNQRADMQRHLKAGRVNNKVLGKRAWGGDPRLFQKKRVPGKRSYAVVLGIDISASTLGLNIALAKRAATAQAELCHRLGVDFAIYAHSAQSDTGTWSDDGLWLDMFEIKSFDQSWNPDTKKALAEISALSENLDGHGVEYYRKLIERHSATDKIILYYSDGKMPAANHDEELEILQREIKYCKTRQITLLGVGIRTDSPRRHGLDTVRVDQDSDISKVVKHLEVALLHNR